LNGAQLASSILFNSTGSRDEPVSLSGPSIDFLLQAIGDHPRLRQATAEDLVGIPVTRAVANFGLVPSHGASFNERNLLPADRHFSRPGKAKSLLQAGGLYLNNIRVESLERRLGIEDFMDGRVAVLRAGREEHLILEIRREPR
jgi:tyrosyl-tRNA synthetase